MLRNTNLELEHTLMNTSLNLNDVYYLYDSITNLKSSAATGMFCTLEINSISACYLSNSHMESHPTLRTVSIHL